MHKPENNEDKTLGSLAKAYQEMSVYLGLGTQMVVTIIFMVFLGKWIDEYFNTKPIFIISFSLLGSFAGIYNFIKSTININVKKSDKK